MVQSPPRSAPERSGHRPGRGAAGFLRDLVVIVVVAVLASFLIKTFLIRSFFIPSESMQNTLQVGDRILVNELVPGLIPLQRGDVVVFTDPGGWLEGDLVAAPPNPVAAAGEWVLSLVGLSTQDANDHLVKRVIGLPGDHVKCCNALGQMSVNGAPLAEPYVVKRAGSDRAAPSTFDITVPAGRLWVMGDNRFNSCDSLCNLQRNNDPYVPISKVVGRAFVISWPLAHWSWLSDHPDTFDGVRSPAG